MTVRVDEPDVATFLKGLLKWTFSESLFFEKLVNMCENRTRAKKHIDVKEAAASKKHVRKLTCHVQKTTAIEATKRGGQVDFKVTEWPSAPRSVSRPMLHPTEHLAV